MKPLKIIFSATFLLVVMTSFSQCSSSKNVQEQNEEKGVQIEFQEKVPFEIGEVNFQRWVAGIQSGGSGINMNIIVLTNKSNVVFDSIYFRGSKAKIVIGKMNYFASIVLPNHQLKDNETDNNQKDEQIPFELKDNECVISYKKDNISYYYKIDNLVEKQPQYYPSAPKDN